uniref:Zgc:113274 n=1 Tax=Cyclopterus lumpus TaxID=8103 RepID=A0A8C2WXR9_CYCLU
MPRNYTRKTTWGQTPLAEMESVAAEVMQGKKSLRKAGRDRNIDKTTLQRFIKKTEKGEAKRIFTDEMEEELAKHLKQLADQFHGLAPVKCRELAFEYAEKNNIPVPANWTEKQCAGQEWFGSFLARRHLSVRTPEATSLGRTQDHFFKNNHIFTVLCPEDILIIYIARKHPELMDNVYILLIYHLSSPRGEQM